MIRAGLWAVFPFNLSCRPSMVLAYQRNLVKDRKATESPGGGNGRASLGGAVSNYASWARAEAAGSTVGH